MIIDEEIYLEHIGTQRHSGRYPWGSGGDENLPRHLDFLGTYRDLKRQGLTDPQIYKGMKINSTEFRAKRTIALNAEKQAKIGMAQRLKDKGLSNKAIGERMGGLNESSIRALLAPGEKDKVDQLTSISNMLKNEVDQKQMVDIGSGVSNQLKVSEQKLRVAAAMLREQDYNVHPVNIPTGPNQYTKMKVLCAPGISAKDAFINRDNIKQIQEWSTDGGRTFSKVYDPISIDPKRVAIKYKEDGGGEADGMLFVRRNVPDVSIGENHYAQVRVQIGENHYLKGMAVYKDDLPPGVDIEFHTPKSSTGNKLDAMKKVDASAELPFGAITHQLLGDQGLPTEHVTSAMNFVGAKDTAGVEGGWAGWSKSLSSQFLSKQSPTIAKQQLDKTYAAKKRAFDEINALTNPTIKKKLLVEFADSADSSAVHLEAAALSRQQAWHVILPIASMPPTQVYAPRYDNGQTVVLIRHPHGGTFEIPELIVNNNNPEAKRLLGPNAIDAVGIHFSVAQHLSGADFDGDTVLVIPQSGKVKVSRPLDKLKAFDPIRSYPKYDGMRVMDAKTKKIEMGKISNLITDMTIKGAPHSEIAQAVAHSMVVIDAEKKELNWKQSEIDHGIPKLKSKYQGGSTKGAATIISRARSRAYVNARKARPAALGGPIDRTTGEKVFIDTNKTQLNKSGKRVLTKTRTSKMAEATDARTLVSEPHGTRMEFIYADHANRLKALANQARLEQTRTPNLVYSRSANIAYAKEVKSLDAKLNVAIMNRPLERQAQVIAGAKVKALRASNENLEEETLKKIRYQAITEARNRMGANKKERQVVITPEEWNAIQSGAISDHKLRQILTNTNVDQIKKLATPRPEHKMTTSKTSQAKSLLDMGYTRAQVAQRLGVSVTTLDLATQ